MRTMCAEQGPCSKKHASPLWNALSCACRCSPPLFCWSLAPHPLPSACHRDSREWIHSKGSQRSLLLNWTRHELGPAAASMHQKHEQFLLAALLCVSWRLLWSTSILLYRSIHLILVCVLYLLLKILSHRDWEQNVVKCFVILQDECLGGEGGNEILDKITEWIDYVSEKEPLICHQAGLMTQAIITNYCADMQIKQNF